MNYLKANDVYPGLHYPVPCHLQKAYHHLGYKQGEFPNSEYLADHSLSLPMYSELKDNKVEKMIELINKYQ